MDCREVIERLSDFRDGSLPPAAAEELSGHLRACAACSEVGRSLDAVRDGLRSLPPVSAPPELLSRVREAVARESGPAVGGTGRSLLSRMKVPLETAAAILLLASAYWYWAGSAPPTAGRPVAPPVEIASPAPMSPAPTAAPAQPAVSAPTAAAPRPKAPPAPVRVARAAPRAVPAEEPAGPAETPGGRNDERSIATLPEGTPDPQVRVYSLADLPTSPVLRASTRFRRILPPAGGNGAAAEPGSRSNEAGEALAHEASSPAAPASRLHPPTPYGRTVSMEVAAEDREEAAERIGEAARRLGGAVEGAYRNDPEGTPAVRVLLPERTAKAFLEEMTRIGKIPPEGMPSRSVLPAGPDPGTIAYTVLLRAR